MRPTQERSIYVRGYSGMSPSLAVSSRVRSMNSSIVLLIIDQSIYCCWCLASNLTWQMEGLSGSFWWRERAARSDCSLTSTIALWGSLSQAALYLKCRRWEVDELTPSYVLDSCLPAYVAPIDTSATSWELSASTVKECCSPLATSFIMLTIVVYFCF